MRLIDVIEMAKIEMSKHSECNGWGFGFNKRKTSLGVTKFKPRRIELSEHFVENNTQTAILETILHEIAHVIAGPTAGHGPSWKSACRNIGIKSDRVAVAEMPKPKYQIVCSVCHKVCAERHRPTRVTETKVCGYCRGKLFVRETS